MIIEISDIPEGKTLKHIAVDVTFGDIPQQPKELSEPETTVSVDIPSETKAPKEKFLQKIDNVNATVVPTEKPLPETEELKADNKEIREQKPIPEEMQNISF